MGGFEEGGMRGSWGGGMEGVEWMMMLLLLLLLSMLMLGMGNRWIEKGVVVERAVYWSLEKF